MPEPLCLLWADLQGAMHVSQGQTAADKAIHMLGLLSPTPHAEPKDKPWVGRALAACSSCTASDVSMQLWAIDLVWSLGPQIRLLPRLITQDMQLIVSVIDGMANIAGRGNQRPYSATSCPVIEGKLHLAQFSDACWQEVLALPAPHCLVPCSKLIVTTFSTTLGLLRQDSLFTDPDSCLRSYIESFLLI